LATAAIRVVVGLHVSILRFCAIIPLIKLVASVCLGSGCRCAALPTSVAALHHTRIRLLAVVFRHA